MRAYDVIEATKTGQKLTEQQIDFFIRGYTSGKVKDYQMAAWLMAVRLNDITEQETAALTKSMTDTGDCMDFSGIKGIPADKHSTGGVGDKTTLICAPIAAACGVPVPKMSGRGLGHTGGTLDKLESIPGFRTELSTGEFFRIVNETGLAVVGQTGNIAPADKKMYALRDVTATVDSLPLIASSIMSKKMAGGAEAIVLDVKTGSGALMKTLEDSMQLAKRMVSIGKHNNRRMAALVTDMNVPLGRAVGNALEVAEAADTLRLDGPEDITHLSCEIAAHMLYLAELGSLQECQSKAKQALASGAAYDTFCRMVELQGGDASVLAHTEKLPQAKLQQPVKAESSGYITSMDTQRIGQISAMLGAGRETMEDKIDYGAGLMIQCKTGDFVQVGDVLAVLHTSRAYALPQAENMLQEAYTISEQAPPKHPLIHASIMDE